MRPPTVWPVSDPRGGIRAGSRRVSGTLRELIITLLAIWKAAAPTAAGSRLSARAPRFHAGDAGVRVVLTHRNMREAAALNAKAGEIRLVVLDDIDIRQSLTAFSGTALAQDDTESSLRPRSLPM